MKPRLTALLSLAACVGTISIAAFSSCKKDDHKGAYAEAVLSGTHPETVVQGTLKFYEQKNKAVKMDLEIVVPEKAGESVAVHLHEHGACGNGGADAHGHWNPTGKPHGEWGSDAFHSGDIGNIELDGNGRGTLTLTTHLWSIGGPDSTNIVGRGVIVHGGVDDYVSQPAGNAGARIGCGAVVAKD